MPHDLRPMLDEVKAQADIVEIVREVVEIKKSGKDWFGVCPFHADKDPSFSVVPEKRMFHCFGCGASGDVFEFWMKYHNVSFMDAARAVAHHVGMEIKGRFRDSGFMQYPRTRKEQDWKPEAKTPAADRWREKATKFMIWANEQIWEHPEVLEWLAKRGIQEGIGRYGLGWNPSVLFRNRESWGLSPLLNNGGRPKPLVLPEGLVIPVFLAGGVGRVRIRRPDPGQYSRYYVVEGSSGHTMMLEPDRPAYVVVESELDAVLIAEKTGDLAGVVALGSVSAKPDEGACALLKKALHVLVALDNDAAGARAWPWWRDNIRDCVRWPVPKGKDPGEAFERGVDIKEWVRAGLPHGLRS